MHEERQHEDGVGGEVHQVEGELLQQRHEERREGRSQPHHQEGEEDHHLSSIAGRGESSVPAQHGACRHQLLGHPHAVVDYIGRPEVQHAGAARLRAVVSHSGG